MNRPLAPIFLNTGREGPQSNLGNNLSGKGGAQQHTPKTAGGSPAARTQAPWATQITLPGVGLRPGSSESHG